MSRGLLFASLAVLLGAAACGPGSYREFRDQLEDASCAWAARCGYVTPGDRTHCPIDDVLGIFHDSTADREVSGAIDVPASVDAGRLRYDSVNAQTCLDAVRGAPCEAVLAGRQRAIGCNAVLAAHVETDRPCWADFECSGSICARAPGCAGLCVVYAAFGAPCINSDTAPAAMQCDPTVAYCGPSAPGGADVCQQKKPEGADCAAARECYFGWSCTLGACKDPVVLGENDACGGTDPCDDSTYCDPLTKLCAKLRRQAEACDSIDACEAGLGCVGFVEQPSPATSGTAGVCTPWLVAGAACTQAAPDTISGCPTVGARCEGGLCTNIVSGGALDADCTSAPCAAGLGCNAVKRCDHLLAIFGDCGGDHSTLCEPGLKCVQDATAQYNRPGTCLPPNVPACFVPSDS